MFSLLLYFALIFLLANSEDPDQTPQFAASDQGLHCLHMSPERVSSLTERVSSLTERVSSLTELMAIIP